jgi:adenine-specific DNA-methyltransferase
MYFPVEMDGRKFVPPGSRGWSSTETGMRRLALAKRLSPQGERLAYIRYLSDFHKYALDNNWTDTAGASDRIYVVRNRPVKAAFRVGA